MATLTIINGAIGTGKTLVAHALLESVGRKRASLIECAGDAHEIVARDLRHPEIDHVIVVDNKGMLTASMFPGHMVFQIHCSR